MYSIFVSFAFIFFLYLTQSAFISPSDEGVQRQKTPGKWNETDLDVSYEKKPHHTYDSWFISVISCSIFCMWRVVNKLGQTIYVLDLGNSCIALPYLDLMSTVSLFVVYVHKSIVFLT